MSYPHKLNPNQCPTVVETRGLMMHFHQCTLKVVKDGFCRVHHPDAVKKRNEEARAKQEERYSNQPWVKLASAMEKIHELQEENRVLRRKLDKQNLIKRKTRRLKR